MALATTCPECQTSFKVVPEQLKLRRGLVRCGVCQHVFSGIDYLRYVGDSRPEPAPVPTSAPEPPADPEGLKTAFFLPDTVIDDRGQSDAATARERMHDDPDAAYRHSPPPAYQAPIQPTPFDAQSPSDTQARSFDESSQAPAAPAHAYEHTISDTAGPDAQVPTQADDEPKSMLVSTAAETQDADRKPNARSNAPDAHNDETDDVPIEIGTTRSPPEPVLRGDTSLETEALITERAVAAETDATHDDAPSEESMAGAFAVRAAPAAGLSQRSILIGTAGLAVLLVLQLVLGSREILAARIPALKPLLETVSAPLGLAIELPRSPSQVTIESFELIGDSRPGVYRLNALLRNRAGHAVQWPAIELTLTNSIGAVQVRKVLAPEQFLASSLQHSGFSAQTEHPLSLEIEVRDIAPSGYRAILFYP